MLTVSLEEAQAKLPQLIQDLHAGQEVLITRDARPVARLIGERFARQSRQPGNCKGMLTIVAEDDDHLKGFVEYMP